MSEREVYLGDGLFASWDGWQIKLRAPREGDDHVVFLEDGLTCRRFSSLSTRCRRSSADRSSRQRSRRAMLGGFCL